MKKRFLGVVGVMLVSFLLVEGRVLRVGTYNLENYLRMDRKIEGKFLENYPKPEGAKRGLRAVIREVNADILAVQEIGGMEYLRELQEDLKLEGLEYKYVTIVEGIDATRHIGLLSKEKIVDEEHHDKLFFLSKGKEKLKVARGLLEATFLTDGVRWKLYTTHLKSKVNAPNSDPENANYRIKEAEVIRQKVVEDFPKEGGGYYVVLGDLNDGPNSAVLKRIKKVGKRILTVPLEASDRGALIWTEYSRYQGAYYRLDYICVSPEMLKKVKGKRASICDAPFALSGSDHRLVYVDLEF